METPEAINHHEDAGLNLHLTLMIVHSKRKKRKKHLHLLPFFRSFLYMIEF